VRVSATLDAYSDSTAADTIDVTIVRALLVPATVALLGELNWWRPRWPGRGSTLPVAVGLDETA
jgi:hypothetical protein